ncbi:hypothetical protein J5N97_011015 [Dioscorea zingiberensis]|uniref:Glucan endo-1,3-beta-D-glucosidase n=1 Tax=Dioscorea zingiberensis TaxID=325984 RepID=A0A9D5CZH6_9LILI|nr:hypothetical protein J5N97_011015 [Dioscorea zingiberensis]
MLTPNKQIVDPNTLFSYSNMFDAMVDAAYYSMKAVNFSGIPVIVTATGWPWFGGTNEKDANVDNALAYNSNLIRHVLNGSGTPSQPETPINTYISELFSEDLQSGSVSEKNWGLFFPNGTDVYSLNFGDLASLMQTHQDCTPGHGSCIFAGSHGFKFKHRWWFFTANISFRTDQSGNGVSMPQPVGFTSLVLLFTLFFFFNL